MTKLFKDFFESEKTGGFLLILCTGLSLFLANSGLREGYAGLWHWPLAGHGLAHWINDGLMTVFFLLVGLELEREIYVGELSVVRNALLPAFGALGGMLLPAGLHLLLNADTPTQGGAGIPMATDIAFALGILSLLGSRVPTSLKVFLTALAVIDDLGAILAIALFYSKGISFLNLGIALGIFAGLLGLNRLRVHSLVPYLVLGAAMWYFMLLSGVHATITGVLLAFAIPFGDGGERSPSYILQHWLHRPVAFLILPVFVLANTAIAIPPNWLSGLQSSNSLGIAAGLLLGKPLGILGFSMLAVALGLSTLPDNLRWAHILGAGFLGGIGFTMSIFITLLAFNEPHLQAASKIAIMMASVLAAAIGLAWLRFTQRKDSGELAST